MNIMHIAYTISLRDKVSVRNPYHWFLGNWKKLSKNSLNNFYIDNELGFLESHCYTVLAFNEDGQSGMSDESCSATFDCAGIDAGEAFLDDCDVCSGG